MEVFIFCSFFSCGLIPSFGSFGAGQTAGLELGDFGDELSPDTLPFSSDRHEDELLFDLGGGGVVKTLLSDEDEEP